MGTEMVVSSVQQSADREWAATHPGYRFSRQPNSYEELKRLRIAQVPLPENQYSGQNAPRYINQDLNDAIERFFVTLPRPDRMAVLRQIVHHYSDQLVYTPLFYNVLSVAANNRVQNVTSGAVMGSNQTWNVQEWALK
jgi:ABC-type transport system substrate-binding protein